MELCAPSSNISTRCLKAEWESNSRCPFENLGILKLAGMTGNVGQEIYGAGESIWMYLMCEALGKADDRELMLVNLDLLDAVHTKEFPPRKLNFILYNPTPVVRSTNSTIPAAGQRTVRLSADRKVIGEMLHVPKQSFIQLDRSVVCSGSYEMRMLLAISHVQSFRKGGKSCNV